jgi:uncharacterized membrane protein
MVITRGYDRLVNLSDAVIAIAVTLLILPLVDAAGDIGDRSAGQFLADNAEQLFLFTLSFVVIANFWLVHHRLYRSIDGYTIPLVWANFLWLLSIVFLPFSTELLGQASGSDQVVVAVYIGTMVVNTYAGVIQQWIIVSKPQMQLESVRGSVRLPPALVPATLMTVALVLSLVVPGLGLWALLILLPTGWITKRVARG